MSRQGCQTWSRWLTVPWYELDGTPWCSPATTETTTPNDYRVGRSSGSQGSWAFVVTGRAVTGWSPGGGRAIGSAECRGARRGKDGRR